LKIGARHNTPTQQPNQPINRISSVNQLNQSRRL
jgi:hypothetical protein